MIEIRRGNNEIQVIGHAKYAPIGKDIVCAGVSTLIVCLVNTLEHIGELDNNYILESGLFTLDIRDLSESGKLLVDSFFIGAKAVAEEFPGYVSIV